MNPLNLLDDAERLRIRGTHDPQHTVITWEVQVGGPPGSRWDTLLVFDAPVGSDPATAYAIPEGLECLVGTAAAHHGLNVHVEPVRGPVIRDFEDLHRRMCDALDAAILPPGHEVESVPAPRCVHNFLTPHTVTVGSVGGGYLERKCHGGGDAPLEAEDYRVDTHREGDEIHVDIAYRVPPRVDGPIDVRFVDGGSDTPETYPQPGPDPSPAFCGSAVPHAPHMHGVTCEHGRIEGHTEGTTWCQGGPADPSRCPGLKAEPPQDPEPIDIHERRVAEHEKIRADHLAGHHVALDASCWLCTIGTRWAADTPPTAERYHEIAASDPVIGELGDALGISTCTHGHTHPHGTDALDHGPTCPGPGAAFRHEGDKISIVPTCQHGRTEAHQIWTTQHADPGHCDGPTRTTPTPDEDTRPYAVGCPTCGRHTCPGRDATTPCVWNPTYELRDPPDRGHTQGHLDGPRQAGSPPAREEVRVNTSGEPVCGVVLADGREGEEPLRCGLYEPCRLHAVRKVDADPPTCSTCDRPIMVVPGAGFGVGASWQHRDGSKGHEARPNLIIDPMPEACRRFHPGERCRPGDNHPAAATPTSAGSTRPMYVTDEELR